MTTATEVLTASLSLEQARVKELQDKLHRLVAVMGGPAVYKDDLGIVQHFLRETLATIDTDPQLAKAKAKCALAELDRLL